MNSNVIDLSQVSERTEMASVAEVPHENLPAVVAANPLDISPEAFSGALARRGQNRKALMVWVRESLVSGVDYGKIHVVSKNKCDRGNACTNPYHFSKDCLFKPGAEKIAGMLGVTPTFPTLHRYEEAALAGVALKQIILRCHMVDSAGRVVADGIGARSLDQDYGDINKSLKMCAKSAHIDATLRMAGLSEVFTQDLDQMKADGKLESSEAPVAKVVRPTAKQYAQRFHDAFEIGIDQAVIELHGELREDEELYREVWGILPSGMRRQIKDLLDREKAHG